MAERESIRLAIDLMAAQTEAAKVDFVDFVDFAAKHAFDLLDLALTAFVRNFGLLTQLSFDSKSCALNTQD